MNQSYINKLKKGPQAPAALLGIGAATAGLGHFAMPDSTQKALDEFRGNADIIKGLKDPQEVMKNYSELASGITQKKMLGMPIGDLLIGARQKYPFNLAHFDKGDNKMLNLLKSKLVDPETGEYHGKYFNYTKNPDLKNISPELESKKPEHFEGVFGVNGMEHPMDRDKVWDSAKHYQEYMKGPLKGRLVMLSETEGGWWGRNEYATKLKQLASMGGKENINRDDLKETVDAASKDREGNSIDPKHMFDIVNGERQIKPEYEKYLKKILHDGPLPKLTDEELKAENPSKDVDKEFGLPDRTKMHTYQTLRGQSEETGHELGIKHDFEHMTNDEQTRVFR